jgi:AcrR family transcriptional regulator
MPRTGLTQEELKHAALDAAEATIRRHGIEKARLVDVAKSIGVNHALLYRLFPDKSALMDAVSERWLRRMEADLAAIAASPGSTADRIKRWLLRLHHLKREKVMRDPELYGAFNLAAEKTRLFVQTHLAVMNDQLRGILSEGMESGEIERRDPAAIAHLLFEGTMTFHHPRFVREHIEEDRTALLEGLIDLLLAGLAGRAGPHV